MAYAQRGQAAKKRSLADLDRLARNVAKLFYEQQLTYGQIGETLARAGHDVRGERDVRLLLNRARDAHRQLVMVRAEELSATAPPVDEELSRRLADQFHIPVAIVARTGNLGSKTTGDDAHQDNDDLHRQLGAVAARHLLAVLRDRDHVGVGAGRGTAFTIDALRPLVEGRRPQGLRIVSLIGAANVVQTWGGFPENLEADNNAGKLAAILGLDPAAVVPVGMRGVLEDTLMAWTLAELGEHFKGRTHPTVGDVVDELGGDGDAITVSDFLAKLEQLVPANPARRTFGDVVREKYAPHLSDESGERLQVALFGFGVLGQAHHLLRFENLVTPAIKSEKDDLQRLWEAHEALKTAIIDVCNSFGLLPVPGVPDDVLEQAQEIVRTLNRKMLVVTPAVLNDAREKILVGGGAAKRPALEAILRHPEIVGIRPTTVVTDEQSAKAVLGL